MMRASFRFRLLLAAALPTLLLAAVLAAIWLHWTQTVLESSLRQRVEAVARQLATASEFHLYTGDIATMQTLVDGVAKDEPDVVAASIVDQEGKVWVRRGDDAVPIDFGRAAQWSLDARGGYMRLVVPITNTPLHVDDFTAAPPSSPGDGAAAAPPLGHVVMRISLRGLNKERDRMLLLGVAAFLVALLIGGGLAIVLARSVTEPLGSIIAMVDRIGRGELDARVELKPDCVLSPLVQGINHMAANVAMTQAELQQRIDEATLELQKQKHAAEREARIDPLTGLNNRRAFLERSERDVQRAGRYRTPVALIMLDLDHFKAINDTHGHPVGDRVLVELATVLLKSMREVDIVGRLGGEEFAILMPDTNAEAAVQAAERLSHAVGSMAVQVEGQTIACTASFGVSAMQAGDGSIHDLLLRADRALYLAKQRGRNRVELFEARPGT